jgi:hypothetical protein
MSEREHWDSTTWEGNRRRQHRDFLALPFRQKMQVIEDLGEVARFFAARRRARGLPVREPERRD